MNYGLEQLIISPTNKIFIEERPLLFFLSLLDTIEPVKCLGRDKIELDPVKALNSIDIKLNNYNKVVITVLDRHINYELWFDKIEESKDWLNVTVDRSVDATCIIKIMPKSYSLGR